MKRWLINTTLCLNGILLLMGNFIIAGMMDDIQAKISAMTQTLDSSKSTIIQEKNYLESVQTELIAQKNNNKVLRIAPQYKLHDPTYAETMAFIQADQTDRKKWIENVYDCKHFAYDVKRSAELKGLNCALVCIVYPDQNGHCLVAFQTTDRGLIFIEPQKDKEVKVEKGVRYSTQLGLRSDQNDTIVDIIVIW